MLDIAIYVAAFAATGFIVLGYWWKHRKKLVRASEVVQKSMTGNLEEPVTLHPVLDPNRCISIGTCATACPEGDIIAMVNGNPQLITPDKCIGHGTCAAVCPVDAITLVFGTATRGVEIPQVKETFETNVPGIYIAGELGGMGLIRNAVEQGKQAIDHIGRSLPSRNGSSYDVAIVGAGPAGIAATLEAERQGLRYITIDQQDIGGTVLSYPRHKLVMTQPMHLPMYGKTKFREITKEDLLDFWRGVISDTGVKINTREKLMSVSRNGSFDIVTSKDQYKAKRLLLAIGRRGTPRKLGVPGEDASKVTYTLIEPEQYRRSKILVVGGGDSALEAALALAAEEGSEVTISYRRNNFSRAKGRNQDLVKAAADDGLIRTMLESEVKQIGERSVVLEYNGGNVSIDNDYVVVCAGGELPTGFLKTLGVRADVKFREA
jgi:thioredoxin reductase/NAD-dependent dihydropyrimidine dehydrogenase PreA subunit